MCLIQVVGGQLKENERITTFASIKESKDIDSRRFDTACVCVCECVSVCVCVCM